MEKFTELTEIGTSDPKVRPDEHPQLAVHGLVVEECKWLSIIAEEISLITLFDITACIRSPGETAQRCWLGCLDKAVNSLWCAKFLRRS